MGRQIEPAVRRGNKARVALSAPAGGGKTFTLLTIATELAEGGDILVIDTERGSASLYADLFGFQTIRWEPPYDPRELAQEIVANGPRFSVIGIDSLTHFWKGEGGTLSIVDQASLRAQGNKYVGWNTGTPAQDAMVNAILTSPCHVIATMRSKMDYVQEKDDKGKTQIRRVGMAPVQRDDLEYEFTITADLDQDHNLSIAKTRCSILAGRVFPAGQAGTMGRVLKGWLDGAAVEVPPTTTNGSNPEAPFHAIGWPSKAVHDEWHSNRRAEIAAVGESDPGRKVEIKAWCDANGLSFSKPVPRGLASAFDEWLAASSPSELPDPHDSPSPTTPAAPPQAPETPRRTSSRAQPPAESFPDPYDVAALNASFDRLDEEARERVCEAVGDLADKQWTDDTLSIEDIDTIKTSIRVEMERPFDDGPRTPVVAGAGGTLL